MRILKFPIENSDSEMFIIVDYISRFKSDGQNTIIYYSESEEFYINENIDSILKKINTMDENSIISIGYPSSNKKGINRDLIEAQKKQKL